MDDTPNPLARVRAFLGSPFGMAKARCSLAGSRLAAWTRTTLSSTHSCTDPATKATWTGAAGWRCSVRAPGFWSSTLPSTAAATSAHDGPWARSGHNVPSKIVYRTPRCPLTSRIVVVGQPIDLSIRMFVLTTPKILLHQVFCGARWNRTIGLSITRAGQRAGQAVGIPFDPPVRATACH